MNVTPVIPVSPYLENINFSKNRNEEFEVV